ncbi:MAG: restriction endonuclease [Betaproteobacteria bacterium]|nr:restriction endonuclease [Betaproteobacteria bacterium]MBI3054323.1 restriction endonuclease [Betaproteobacteria bacterium]
MALRRSDWEFELLVGEFFRQRGFKVEETGGSGADGGVDLVIAQGNDRYVVQCKQWKARQVGVSTVRELYGVMTAQGAVGGFVVTSGAFTEDARRFAEGREIELVARDQLLAMVREQHSQPPPVKAAKPAAATAPSCPQCNSPMVLRTARKGAQAGSSFWGCPKYPACRGTRPV